MSAQRTNTHEREFLFTDHDFARISKLIYAQAGINLSHHKRDMVYSRLTRRLRAHGIQKFSDYIDLVLNQNSSELEFFINALTTNLTSFFREAHHFPILAEHLQKHTHRRPLKIWCSAAASGEEPYTIAMTVVDLFESYSPPVEIIATDIDTHALKKAEDGVYTLEQVEKIPPSLLKRYFLKGRDKNLGKVRIRPELQSLITFKQLNLQDDKWGLPGPFDAIFCRNVMIYFDKPTQYKILKKFIPLMQKDGLLFAGHSESLQTFTDMFQLEGKTVYSIAQNYKALANTAKLP